MHNSFLVYFLNLYMFRPYLGPSSGGTTICIQQLVLIILFRLLSVAVVGMEQSNQDNRRNILRIICILRISCASSWFFITRGYMSIRGVTSIICKTHYILWFKIDKMSIPVHVSLESLYFIFFIHKFLIKSLNMT